MKFRAFNSVVVGFAALFLTGCPSGGGPSRPVQYLQFNYVVLPTVAAGIESLNDAIMDNNLSFDDAVLAQASSTPCEYMATFSVTSAQSDSDLPLDQRTKVPELTAYGSPSDPTFNFTIQAFQSRNMRPLCSTLAQTVQGLTMVSIQAPVDGQWRHLETIDIVFRPDLTSEQVGSPVVFQNSVDGDYLVTEYAVDSVSSSGYVEGRFRFLAASEAGDLLVIANDGQFGISRQ